MGIDEVNPSMSVESQLPSALVSENLITRQVRSHADRRVLTLLLDYSIKPCLLVVVFESVSPQSLLVYT